MKINNVGVLMGGDSTEREISLRSGKAIAAALRSQGLLVVEIGEKEPVREGVLASSIDVAFIALHGKNGEDGTIQQFLEDQGIPYTGSGVAASRLAIDKIRAKETLMRHGISTPAFEVVTAKTAQKFLQNCHPERSEGSSKGRFFGLRPQNDKGVVVKPARQGSSIGVTVVRHKKDLNRAIEEALSYDEEVLIEEFIQGRELTVGVLGENPLPVVEIRPKTGVYDFTSKYTAGMTEYLAPAPLDEKTSLAIRQTGLAAHRALGCRDLSRTDILRGSDGKFFVLEVNTIPGFTQTSLLPKAARAAGITFENLCLEILEFAVRRDKRISDLTCHPEGEARRISR